MTKADSQARRLAVRELSRDECGTAVAVLCDAFHAYPVMRFVLGPIDEHYDGRLHVLVDFFVRARFWRDEPVLGVTEDNAVLAAALVTLPGDRESPTGLAAHRENVWKELGPSARARYDAFGRASREFVVDQPHYHLNMIGVRRSHVGRGLARRLLNVVHERSRDDPDSCGVSLSTEDPNNVALYEHAGYRLLGHKRVSEGLETWGFFRPDDKAG